MTETAGSANGKVEKTKSTFRMSCGVAINIQAKPDAIWALLTDAAGFPRWNSTVTNIEGSIALGQTVKVKVPASERLFKLTISEFEPARRMVWQDGMAPMFKARRTYTLSPRPDGSTDFSMVEVFAGLMLPMIKGQFPDFGPSFEQYAADLKKAAERV